MQNPTLFLIVAGTVLWLPIAAHAADNEVNPADRNGPSAEEPAAPVCRKASVNPVTGHAICLEPRGAPVTPPPREALQRPCPPRKHDDDPWTMYEHWSGCHTE